MNITVHREIGDNLKQMSAMKINKHPAYIVYKSLF